MLKEKDDLFGQLNQFFSDRSDLPDKTPYIKIDKDEDLDSIFKSLNAIDDDELSKSLEVKEKKKTQKKIKRKIAVIDCETDPFEFENYDIAPFLWGFYDGHRYIEFTYTRLLIKFLRKSHYYVFAHNGGRFDYHFILNYIEYGQRILLINNRLSKFSIGNSIFLDSYNLLPEPLSAMQKDEINYQKMHKSVRHLHMDEIKKYLRGDCVYLFNYVSEFIKLYGFNITMAGAAFKFWRTKLSIKNQRPHQSKHNFDFLRQYYYGGRVTPFKKGIIKPIDSIKCYDINSAYPFVMRNEQHPISTTFYKAAKLPDTENEIKKCFICLDCKSNGALPIRLDNGGIDFPHSNDVRTYYITGFEFIVAIKTKTITNIKINSVYMFNEYTDFKEYIDIFFKLKYEAKKDGRKAHYLFAKKMQNSLYGKFASDYSDYSEYIIDQYGSLPPDGFRPDCVIGNHQLYSRDLPESEQKYINIATSASITGAVRAYLWENICKCDDVFYCDTDSIFCTDGSKLNLGDELGQWELEAEGFQMAIAAKKLYCLWLNDDYIKGDKKHKIASKGVHLNADEIYRVASGESVRWRSEAPSFSLKTGINYIERNIQMNL